MRDLKFSEFAMKLKNIRETGGVIEKSVLRMNLNYCVVPTHVDSSYGKLELIKLSSLFTTEVQVRICVIGESHLEVSARYLRLQVLDNNKFLIPFFALVWLVSCFAYVFVFGVACVVGGCFVFGSGSCFTK